MSEQNRFEALCFLRLTAGAKSILEIGSRKGSFLRELAGFAQPGAKIYSIDLGRDVEGNYPGEFYGNELRETVKSLCDQGFNAECLISDSRQPDAIAWAASRAPFDLIFIDGDHSAEGVRADWNSYSHMGQLVAFHDLFNGSLGVGNLWQEIAAERNTAVIRGANSLMGIGIVFRDSPLYAS